MFPTLVRRQIAVTSTETFTCLRNDSFVLSGLLTRPIIYSYMRVADNAGSRTPCSGFSRFPKSA